jgi:hypothetical protein
MERPDPEKRDGRGRTEWACHCLSLYMCLCRVIHIIKDTVHGMHGESATVHATHAPPLHTTSGRGFGRIYPHDAILRERTPRTRADGRAAARHLHGNIERAVRCVTVKVLAESAGAVAINVFFESLTTRQSGRLAQPGGGAGTPAGRGCHLQGRSAPPS